MKKNHSEHGSRHRPSGARRRYRDLRHQDDSVDDLHRANQDQMEYEQWLRDESSYCCRWCYPDPAIYLDGRLLFALIGGQWDFPLLERRVDTNLWEQLQPPHKGPTGEGEYTQESGLPSAEGLAENLRDFFGLLKDPNCDVRALLSPSAAEMAVLSEFRRRWLVSWGTGYQVKGIDHALSMVLLMERFWLRDLSVWKMPVVCGEAEFKELLRHLFVRYPVPDWLLGLFWISRHELPLWKWVMWLIILGAGGSLPIAGRVLGWWVNTQLTQVLLACDEEVPPDQACLISEVKRLGGSRVLAHALLGNHAFAIDPTEVDGRMPATEWRETNRGAMREFWGHTVNWLIRKQEELPEELLPDILAWAVHEYTEQRARGQVFTWKGRTPEATLRAAALYANSRPEVEMLRVSWAAQGWDWTWADEAGAVWSIRELTVGRELRDEGQAMHHCVGSYIISTRDGHQAIFSLRKNGQRVITIDVRLPERTIWQAYGVCNRPANEEEEVVVNRWKDNFLKLSV